MNSIFGCVWSIVAPAAPQVRIYCPAKSASTQGLARSSFNQSGTNWRIEFVTQEKWVNPLMGWTSSSDPMVRAAGLCLAYALSCRAMFLLLDPRCIFKALFPGVKACDIALLKFCNDNDNLFSHLWCTFFLGRHSRSQAVRQTVQSPYSNPLIA